MPQALSSRTQIENNYSRSQTGLGYYGARYYNPTFSVWLGVDAMASNGHNLPLTPYHFSANNPVNIIDPDSNDWYKAKDGSLLWSKGKQDNISLASEVDKQDNVLVQKFMNGTVPMVWT